MKKALLLIPALVVALALPVYGAESKGSGITVYDAKISNGRTLVPLRVISEHLGSKVTWNQKNKTVTVDDGQNKTLMTVNSKNITFNGKPETMDASVLLHKGKIYVPLVASSPKGSAFIWDNINKVAHVSYKGKHVNIIVRNAVKETKVTEERKLALVKKADEIKNLSSIKQKRAYFKPYFTDKFINKIISLNGIGETNSEFGNVGSYVDYNDNGKVTIYQSDERYEDLTIYTRILYLVKENGVYKVDDIYTREEEYLIR